MLHESTSSRTCPALCGIEWAGSLADEILERADEISCLEIIPENFFGSDSKHYRAQLFDKINALNIPVIIHSVELSLGSLEPFRYEHFQKILKVSCDLPVLSFSDHLCLTEMNGIKVGQLTPIQYCDATLDAIASKIDTIQSITNTRFLIENIALPFIMPDHAYSETAFINLLQMKTGSGLLLDLNNLYSNSINFDVDPYRWISEIDLEAVGAIHVAGGYYDGEGFLQDGHCERVPSQVWQLLDYVIAKAGRPITTIVERTSKNEAGLHPILSDVKIAQSVLGLKKMSSCSEEVLQ